MVIMTRLNPVYLDPFLIFMVLHLYLPSGNGSIPSAYRPKRGPNIIADANAEEPPKDIGEKNN